MPTLREISLISADDLVDRYSVLLLDAYGVLVHGGGALPGAVEFIDGLNRIGKPYYVLTNDTAKLPATAAARYRGFGLDLDSDRIISAGTLLQKHFADHGLIELVQLQTSLAEKCAKHHGVFVRHPLAHRLHAPVMCPLAAVVHAEYDVGVTDIDR